MQHEPKMAEIATELESRGYVIDKPNIVEGHVYTDNLDANAHLKRGFIDEHFAKIDSSEAVLVVNEEKNGVSNYIGGNTLIEIAYAYSQKLDIFLLNPVPKLGYADEINGMHPTILDGNLDKIDEYVQALPLVYMSTESALKQTAVSRTMRRAGIPVRVDGKKVDSGVDEQPQTLDETYTGAINRHENLKKLGVSATYYVTVESGLDPVHKNHNSFGCAVVILEKVGKEPRIGIDFDIEYPKDVLDKIPSEYADVGVYAQEVLGAVSKDLYPFLTSGKIARQELIENAMYKLAVQL